MSDREAKSFPTVNGYPKRKEGLLMLAKTVDLEH